MEGGKTKKCSITFSHRVSGGSELLYVGIVLFGYTVRCVVVVFVAAYRISAPTNKPVKQKQFLSENHSHFFCKSNTENKYEMLKYSVCKHRINYDDNYCRHETPIWIVLNFVAITDCSADSREFTSLDTRIMWITLRFVAHVFSCHMVPIHCGFSKHSHGVWSAEPANEFISSVLISRINTHYLFIRMYCVRG